MPEARLELAGPEVGVSFASDIFSTPKFPLETFAPEIQFPQEQRKQIEKRRAPGKKANEPRVPLNVRHYYALDGDFLPKYGIYDFLIVRILGRRKVAIDWKIIKTRQSCDPADSSCR